MQIKFGGVTIGGGAPLRLKTWEPPVTDLRTDYQERLNRDGLLAARDWLGSANWQFTVRVKKEGIAEALAEAARLENAWKKASMRNTTTKAPLDYSFDGKTWQRVYGRPGQFAGITPDFVASLGLGLLDLQFTQLDPAHYSAAEHSVVIPVVPASHGGIIAPLVAPITTVASGEPRVGGIDNAGDLPSPARVVFHGPCTNPVLTTDKGYKIGYVGSVAYDQTVTISAWDSTIIKTPPRASVAGDLDRRTRLSRLVVPSGHSEWYFEATDATGTASATVYWRDAYTAMQA